MLKNLKKNVKKIVITTLTASLVLSFSTMLPNNKALADTTAKLPNVTVGLPSGGMYSTMNGTWTYSGVPNSKIMVSGASSDGNMVIAANNGTAGEVFTSSNNGLTWKSTLNNTYPFNTVVYANGVFIVGGGYADSSYGQYTTFAYMSSDNGNTWKKVVDGRRSTGYYGGTYGQFAGWLQASAYGDGKFVLFGNYGAWANPLVSTDGGEHFTAGSINNSGFVYDVTYGNGQFVAVGSNSNSNALTATSTDGKTWLVHPVPVPYSSYLLSVAYGNGVYVASGSMGTLYTSVDGIAWKQIQGSYNNPTVYNKIRFDSDSGYFLLGNNTSLMKSTDGVNWSSYGNYSGGKVTSIIVKKYSPLGASLTSIKTSSSISLSYASIDNAVSYEVYKNEQLISTISDLSYTDSNLTPGTTYNYKIVAKDASGAILDRGYTSVTTSINPVTNVKLSEVADNGTASLSWDTNGNPSGTSYNINIKNLGDPTQVNTTESFENTNPVIPMYGNWQKVNTNSSDGQYSMQSAYKCDNCSSNAYIYNIIVPANSNNAQISFDYKVSSEELNDNFIVMLDGNQVLKTSGNLGWKTYTAYFLNNPFQTNHSLYFYYQKNASLAKYDDSVNIDNIKLSYKVNGNQVLNVYNNASNIALSNLGNKNPYDITITANYNGQTSNTTYKYEGTNNLSVATQDVAKTEALVNGDLSTQLLVDAATKAIFDSQVLVDKLPDGNDKTQLQTKLNDATAKVQLAQDILNAKNGVDSATTLATADLSTQPLIDSAKQAIADAQILVNKLPDGDIKTGLQNSLNDNTAKVQLAQDILNAKNGVANATTISNGDLSTQVLIDSAKQAISDAQVLVNKLPDIQIKSDLQSQLNADIFTVNIAQATLDVQSAEQVKTQSAVDTARQSVSLLPEGTIKTAFTERLNIVQKIIDANLALDTIVNSNLNTYDSIDNSIIQLGTTKALIDSLPDSADKTALLTKYKQTNDYVEQSLETLLNQNTTGKPVALSDTSLDYLVKYTIQKIGATSVQDRGSIHSYVMPLLKGKATGNQVNQIIDAYFSTDDINDHSKK
jgi:hypothetical protein